MKNIKRMITLVLALVLCFSLLGVTALADRGGNGGRSGGSNVVTNSFTNTNASAGTEIWYSKNGSALVKLDIGSTTPAWNSSDLSGIMFFVKVILGYSQDSLMLTFDSNNQAGNQFSINSVDKTVGGVNFSGIINDAINRGFTIAFYYSLFGDQYVNRTFHATATADVTVQTYSVTYNFVDESGTALRDAVKTDDYQYGISYGMPASISNYSQNGFISGYKYKALKEGSDPISGTINSKDVVVTLVYEAVYTVTYDVNGGTAGTGPAADTNVPNGAHTLNTTTTPTKASDGSYNYSFVGWGTTSASTAKVTSVTVNGSDVTVYAIWKSTAIETPEPPAPTTYTVTYDVNGGTGTMTDANSPYLSGSTVTVLANGFTAPSGMQFAGWNTTANGDGTDYAAKDTFTITANVTLYAKWSETPEPPAPTPSIPEPTYYTLTVDWVDENGVKLADTATKTYVYGAAYAAEQKTFDGYTFSALADGSADATGKMTANRHVTFVYAKDITEDPVPGGDNTGIDDGQKPNDGADKSPATGDAGSTAMIVLTLVACLSACGLVVMASRRKNSGTR